MKFLIIDDSIFVHKMVERALLSLGHEVVGFADHGLAGIDLYNQLRPDAVILDINMPGMSGASCAREIINIDPDAKIIILSSIGAGELVAEAEAAGVRHFLMKPLNTEELTNILSIIMH